MMERWDWVIVTLQTVAKARRDENEIEIIPYQGDYAVDLVIYACLHFCEFLILGLFTKLRIREFSFFFSSAI